MIKDLLPIKQELQRSLVATICFGITSHHFAHFGVLANAENHLIVVLLDDDLDWCSRVVWVEIWVCGIGGGVVGGG